MINVVCLLLAAGSSRRMQNGNKLLAPFGATPVITHVAQQISLAKFSKVVIVTGHDRNQVEAALGGLENSEFVFNARFDVGMHASIRCGLERLNLFDFVAICLGDQPLLATADYDRMILAAAKNPRALLLSPRIDGLRGNPVLIAKSLVPEILEHPDDDRGCAYLFKKYNSPEQSVSVEFTGRTSAFAFLDVDTPDALEQARSRFTDTVGAD